MQHWLIDVDRAAQYVTSTHFWGADDEARAQVVGMLLSNWQSKSFTWPGPDQQTRLSLP